MVIIMKAAVFYGKNDLRIEEIPIPEISADEVLIRVRACGICGTDLHIFDGDEGAAPTPAGTVLGHEFSGEVIKIGELVKTVSVGDTVCVDPNKLCGYCDYCRGGIGHFCENIVGIGTTVNGGFEEYCRVPQSQVYPFPKSISFEKAAMAEPVACCLHGVDMCDISCGGTVLIIGGGMIGLIMLQLAKLRGASVVALSEPIKEKRVLAERLGADIVIDPFNEDLADKLKEHNVKRVGTVIESAGRLSAIEQAIQVAGNKSTVMMFGLTKPDETITVKPFEIFKKEITLKSSYINPYTYRRALDMIVSGKLDVSSMIYRTAELEELPGILADKKARSAGKYIIKL